MERQGIEKRNGRILNPALTTMRTKGHFKPKMSWEEREKVLRIVFSKINSGEMPLYWREIEVDELKEELIKENLNGKNSSIPLITGEEMKKRLTQNLKIQKELIQGEISEENRIRQAQEQANYIDDNDHNSQHYEEEEDNHTQRQQQPENDFSHDLSHGIEEQEDSENDEFSQSENYQ